MLNLKRAQLRAGREIGVHCGRFGESVVLFSADGSEEQSEGDGEKRERKQTNVTVGTGGTENHSRKISGTTTTKEGKKERRGGERRGEKRRGEEWELMDGMEMKMT